MAKKNVNPTRRKALAKRKMVASRVAKAKKKFKASVRARVDANDPWKRKAKAKVDRMTAAQRKKYEDSQASTIPSTSVDKSRQELAGGVNRKLNELIESIPTKKKKRKK